VSEQPQFGRSIATVEPSSNDAAYAAGFFDGEGHITIAFMLAKRKTLGTTYMMRVGASQNNPAPLLWLRERWGGSVLKCTRRTDRDHETYKWVLCSRKAAVFLIDVLPYLKIKQRRAGIALRFQAKLFIPGCKGHTSEYRAELETLRLEMTGLNTHKPFSGRVVQ
jgi:hypothetical protein